MNRDVVRLVLMKCPGAASNLLHANRKMNRAIVNDKMTMRALFSHCVESLQKRLQDELHRMFHLAEFREIKNIYVTKNRDGKTGMISRDAFGSIERQLYVLQAQLESTQSKDALRHWFDK